MTRRTDLRMSAGQSVSAEAGAGSWREWLRHRHVELLVILFVALLPFGEAFHLPVLILLGLSVAGIRRGGLPRERGMALYAGIVALLTVPLLIAAVGAHDVEKTLLTALIFLLYATAGLHVVRRFRTGFDAGLLLNGISAVLLVWMFDALVQYFAGSNLLGWPYDGRRLTGIFHPDKRIGIVFAHLSPFFIAAVQRRVMRSGRQWPWLMSVPFIAVILLSGSRAAWVTLALVAAAYALLFSRARVYRLWHIILLLAVAAGGSLLVSEDLQQRVGQTLKGFSTDVAAINEATSLRMEVWQGAWRLYLDAPVTGNGVEALPELGFQRGYTSIPFGHAHFYALDVLLVTGAVGFVAYLTAFAAVCKKGFDAYRQIGAAFPFWLAAAAMMFPLNLHWEFYGVRPYAMMWLLLILAFAAAGRDSAAQRAV